MEEESDLGEEKLGPADKIIEEAYAKAEEIKKEAYAEGKRQAEMDCEEIKLEAERLRANAENILNEVLTEKEMLFKNTEKEMVELIYKITKKIISKCADEKRENIVFLVKAALTNLSGEEKIKVKVSEDDYDHLMDNKELLTKELDNFDYDLIKDCSLEDESCVIETPFGTMDYSTNVQLGNLESALATTMNEES